MKAKMILKKGMVFLFAMVMVLTGIFSLGVMAASGLEGAYISPKSKMGLQYANNFSRDVSKSQVSVPNFMADSDTNGEEPNKSFNAQQVAAGNSDAGQKWRGFAAYAKNHDPSDFWVKYKNVTTANGKSVDLKIEVTDWKTQNDESKPLPSNGDMFGHDNNSAHLGYAIGFSYKKTGVVMFSGFKWVKFKYTFLYNGTNTKAPFTGFATFQDIDQNQYVTITDGTECISKASYIGGSDGNTWCEPDGWTYKAIKDQNASSDMGKDTFNKTCISLYVKDMTDMSIKYGWTGHTAIAYFDLAPWAMNSFEDNANPDVPKKLIQSGSSWISNEKTSAVAYKLGDTYSYRYEDTTPTYATDILSNLWTEQKKTAISSYVWEDTLDSGLSYVAGSLQVDVGGKNLTSLFTDYSSGQNIKFSATSDVLNDTSFYGKKVTVTFKVKIRDAASYSWLGHERTADNKYRLIPNTAKRRMTYLKKLAYDEKKEVYTVTDDEFGEQVADIIVNEQGQVIAEDLWHGFSPEAMKLIGEYLLSKSLYQKKEAAYLLPEDNGYFMIHETDGGYDYTFYNHEFKELDGGIYDNPEVSIAEATEDILNDEGITIENIRETDYEKLEQDIEEAEYIVKVDFYVAECSEFPSLGEYHEGLTLDEAIKIYEKIPEERMHGRKGIGIDLHFPEENLYPGKCSLFEGGEICREFLDIVPFYKENKEVQKAVNYLENHFNKKEKSLMKPKKPEQAPRL